MTTLRLPEALLREVESIAGASDEQLSRFIEAALHETLARRRARDLEPEPLRISPVGSGDVLPPADLTRWAQFLESQAAVPRHRQVHLSA
jgi:hypothetical protein